MVKMKIGFVTFVGFTCQYRAALSARMSIFQCLKTFVAEPNRRENRLFFANVTMPPPKIIRQKLHLDQK